MAYTFAVKYDFTNVGHPRAILACTQADMEYDQCVLSNGVGVVEIVGESWDEIETEIAAQLKFAVRVIEQRRKLRDVPESRTITIE